MGTRGAVLPRSEGGVANPVRRAAHARSRTGIDVGTPNPASRRAGAITEGIEVGVANRLPRPAASIGIEEGGVADVDTGTRLRQDNTWDEQEEENGEEHGTPP